MEGLSEALGFSYALMMGTGGRYWKVYLGGEENYNLYLPEELMQMAEVCGPNPKAVSQLRDAFNTTSIYLWDVDADEVIMQTLGSMHSYNDPIRDCLSKATNKNTKDNRDNGEISTDFTKNKDPDKSKPFWNRMFDFLIK